MAIKHSVENNGLVYMQDIMYRDHGINKWRLKD